jgi:transcriptional regulator with XRE-family HTH domain
VLQAIGLKIQMLRKQKRLTQQEFAEKLEISRSYMGYIEQGRQYTSLKLLIKIAELLGIDLHELLKV